MHLHLRHVVKRPDVFFRDESVRQLEGWRQGTNSGDETTVVLIGTAQELAEILLALLDEEDLGWW